jgi:endonuclease III
MEKPRRILELTEFLLGERVETEEGFAEWLTYDQNIALLRQVRGVGPKTADYIKSIVGIPTVAVDRHVRAFVRLAGLEIRDYDQIRETVCAAADILGYDHSALDHAIWVYSSTVLNRIRPEPNVA